MNTSVILEKENDIAVITFNRPESMNTYNVAMSEELLAISDELLRDTETRIVIVKGAGPVFMAGGDIHYFKSGLESMPKGVHAIIRTLAATIQNFRLIKKPIIAAVHGAVAGAGLSVMLACDLVVASSETKFTTAYSALGVSPDGGMSYFLPRLLGTKKAMQLMLTSEQFSAIEAYQWGLVNEVTESSLLVQTVENWVKRLTSLPVGSLNNIKQLTYLSEQQGLAAQCESEAESFVALTQTEDFKIRVNAFLDKRKTHV